MRQREKERERPVKATGPGLRALRIQCGASLQRVATLGGWGARTSVSEIESHPWTTDEVAARYLAALERHLAEAGAALEAFDESAAVAAALELRSKRQRDAAARRRDRVVTSRDNIA